MSTLPKRRFSLLLRGIALGAAASLALPLTASPVRAADLELTRVKGTVGVAGAPGGNRHEVVTSSGLPATGEAYALCSSMAAVNIPAGQLYLGGGTTVDFADGGSSLKFLIGVLRYDASAPIAITTPAGVLSVPRGSGYVIAGSEGTQVIVLDGGPTGASFNPGGAPTVVANAKVFTVPKSGVPALSDLSTVNNPAIYQFNEGHDPLPPSGAKAHDPVEAPPSECFPQAATGIGGAALLALGLVGAGAAVAVAGGGGGGGSTSTPTPVPTLTPVPTNTPTPAVTATPGVTATPTATSTATNTATPGAIVLSPNPDILTLGIGSTGLSTFTITQANYSGPWTITQPSCPVGLLGSPTASISGNTVTISIPSQVAALALGCSLIVNGGGGQQATENLTLLVSALGPSPTPTPTSGLGPVIPNPASVLLNPGLGSPATQVITVTQAGYSGPFTANVSSCLSIGSPPTVSVSGSTITFSLPGQTLAVDLGCNVVITGGGGMSAVVPVTITVGALVPTPVPTTTASGSVPLVANPASILLDPGITQPATANIIVTPTSEGPFSASTSCALPLGTAPVTTVTGNVVSVTISGQLINAQVACSTTITSPSTGQSVVVPVLVAPTVIGTPTASPSPGASAGPLTASPSSVLLLPGVAQNAQANILLSDPGYTGAYAASASCGLALTQPTVTVSGSVVTIAYPGTILNAALGCNVTITTSIGQSLVVPITIAATVLGSKVTPPGTEAIAFRPPSLTLAAEGRRGSVTVVRGAAPFGSSVSCPAGTSLATATLGARIELDVTARGTTDALCRLTVLAADGAFADVPIRVAGAHHAIGVPAEGTPVTAHATLPQTIGLNVGERRQLRFEGFGPFVVSGCDGIADLKADGDTLDSVARASGTCTATLRGRDGSMQTVLIQVRATRAAAPVTRRTNE